MRKEECSLTWRSAKSSNEAEDDGLSLRVCSGVSF